MIKEHFEKSERSPLPPGHPIVAFTESQISTVTRVVADESAQASYDCLRIWCIVPVDYLELHGPVGHTQARRVPRKTALPW